MAFHWCADDGRTWDAGLVAMWIFRGSGPVLLRNPILCDFSGGGVQTHCPPLPPLWIHHVFAGLCQRYFSLARVSFYVTGYFCRFKMRNYSSMCVWLCTPVCPVPRLTRGCRKMCNAGLYWWLLSSCVLKRRLLGGKENKWAMLNALKCWYFSLLFSNEIHVLVTHWVGAIENANTIEERRSKINWNSVFLYHFLVPLATNGNQKHCFCRFLIHVCQLFRLPPTQGG